MKILSHLQSNNLFNPHEYLDLCDAREVDYLIS